MFEEMMEFKQVLLLWEAKYINFAIVSLESPTWVIVKIIITYLNLMVNACVINQSKGHWL